ncbi:transcription factor bHLH110-like [Gastrolobium bilobum]|uniref:transcription factor bHLH110-like n=1 Tax=Gastrolobium bilobum TaxID=150636 RepID=UPI002AB19B96|nr:transcription factor bHLH110-like [Gastrolobium bilobum]
MIQDLGYHHWTSTDAERCLEFSKIKEENSVDFPKFSEMLNRPSSMEGYQLACTTSTTNNQMKNIEHKDMNALNEKLLFKTLLSGDLYSSTSAQNYPNFGGTSMPSRGNFSQIYPSINISNLNQSTTYNSTEISRSTLDMNTQSLDLLTTARSYSEGLSQHSQDHDGLGRFPDNVSFHLHQMQLSNDRSSCGNSSNPSHFTNGTAETKRPCTLMESKTSQSQTASKKSRLESRPSCPPFKVRKEKLGDRIAALQQLVAPFGKTDTASVLMEAIGYIKFLQGQVETLSVPYMKSSQNQTNRVMQGGSAIGADANGEPKQDLRSRGLCLVPLSCMSYIAGDGGNEVWQQPNFGGAT